MKVALVTAGQEVLGVECLSSMLKSKGHDVRLFFDPQIFSGSIFLKIDFLQRKFDLLDKVVDRVIKYQPDIIGFSCMTHNYHWSILVAQKIKQVKSIPIIFGGIHPTSVPDMVLANECVDMVAVGEGELSFSELLEKMEKDRQSTDVKGIYFKNNGKIIKNPPYPLVSDLDSLPYPDKQLFYDKVPAFETSAYSIMTSRGCPFSCSYCCNDFLKKLYKGQFPIRRRSVDNVIAELKLAKTKFRPNEIFFTDEVFAFNDEWLEEFSVKYEKEIGIPFAAYYHFKFATEKRIKLLKKAGCFQLFFGMQSASERIRKEVCNRNYTNKEASKAIELCNKYGIIIFCDHIFGLPFETEYGWAEAVEFYRNSPPSAIYTYWLTYFPSTSIIEKGKEAGLLKDEDIKLILDGRQSYFHKGTAIADRKTMLIYQLLFDLIPLMPKKLHKWLTDHKWLLKALPKGYVPHMIFNIITRFKLGMPVFSRFLAVAISKKNVP